MLYTFPLSLLSYSKIRTNVSPFIFTLMGLLVSRGKGKDADVASVGSEKNKDRDVSLESLTVFS